MSKSPYRMTVLFASLALAAAAAHANTFQEQVAADPHGEVDVSNISGDIVISGWDKAQVAVTADVPSDTQRVRLITGGGHTRVCVTYGNSNGCDSHGWNGDEGSVDLEIHVPQGSRLDVSGVNSDITSRGVKGSQRLHTVNGGINADLGSGDDEVDSVSGTVTLHGSGQDGTLHVGSVSGDVRVTDIAGELEARSVGGNVMAQMSSARLVRLNTTSGSIDLTASLSGGGTIETETMSGNQTLAVSAPGGYSYDAKTFSGDISNCYGQRSDKSEYGPGNRLEGKRGGGGGQVRVQTMSGDISLCDR